MKYQNHRRRSKSCRCHCIHHPVDHRILLLHHSLLHSWGNCVQCVQSCRLQLTFAGGGNYTFVAVGASATHSTTLLRSRSVLLRAFPGEMSSFSTAVAGLAFGGFGTISRKVARFCYHVSKSSGETAPSHRAHHSSHPRRGEGCVRLQL